MNIFGSLLSLETMKKRTSGGEGCDGPGDYLRYIVEQAQGPALLRLIETQLTVVHHSKSFAP